LQKQPKLLEYFFPGKSHVLILAKKWLGYILGDFLETHLVTLNHTSSK
jgi:hypothetical protein